MRSAIAGLMASRSSRTLEIMLRATPKWAATSLAGRFKSGWSQAEAAQEHLTSRLACPAGIVIVPLGLPDQLEAMAHVKVIGPTALQGPNPNRLLLRIGLLEDLPKHLATDTHALVFRRDVEVIEREFVLARTNNDKADDLAILLDDPRVDGAEGGKKALLRPNGVESPGRFQARAHSLDTKLGEFVCLGGCRWTQEQARACSGCQEGAGHQAGMVQCARRQAAAAVSLTPRALQTFWMVSKRGWASGRSAL